MIVVHTVQSHRRGNFSKSGALVLSTEGSFTCDDAWDAKLLYPSVQEGRCAVGGGGGSERDRFRPASRSIHHGEQVRKS